jgi:hypothetical protein
MRPVSRVFALFRPAINLALCVACACAPALSRASDKPGKSLDPAAMSPYHCFAQTGDFGSILSDTEGVDFCYYLKDSMRSTRDAWVPLIPREVQSPIYKAGVSVLVFTISPSGHVVPESLHVQQTSGDPALDRASRGAIETAVFQPLPAEYHGSGLTLSFRFYYNTPLPDAGPTPAQMTPRATHPGIFNVSYSTKLCCKTPRR